MKLAGLEIKIDRSAIYAFGVMVIALVIITSIVALANGDLQGSSFLDVIIVALAAAIFHFIAQFVHLSGHALAAWLSGYPKRGMWFLYIFAMSLYPPDEPILPARIHIQRSLGGVLAFGLLLVIVLALWLNTRDSPQWTLRYLTTYMLIDAALLFAVSALISDGLLFIVRKEWLNNPPPS